ncbi:MAG: hypothetical protein Q9195_004464 [Heterodermia aff. obscurata]
MDSEDGKNFIKNLAHFVRTHEKALANALQLRKQGPKASQKAGDASPTHISGYPNGAPSSSTSSAFAAALSLGTLSFSSQNIKPAKLTLTPHHLFYLLSRFEEIGIPIGPMNVRLESLHAEASPANYVSFLSQTQRSRGRSDRSSIHSVSSVRSVMSGMSSLWSNLGIGHSSSAAKGEKAMAQLLTDTKYLYSAFTKIPCLRLSPDRKARLIGGYEEFPFDTAVPLLAFKNLSALEICDVDFRQFFGWDRLAEQLRSLTLKRANIEDPTDLVVGIVLDDMDKRRRRSSRVQASPVLTWPSSPFLRYGDQGRPASGPNSPTVDDKRSHSTSPRKGVLLKADSEESSDLQRETRRRSTSPSRPSSSRQDTTHKHIRGGSNKMKRSTSGSSNSSDHSNMPHRSGSSSNLLSMGILPASKWRFLKHLSLADNSLTSMTTSGLAPLANTLHSLDLSSNLFAEIPDCLASLTGLRALNLSNWVERLLSLERLDLRDNSIQDPTELARLTGIPNFREIWIANNFFTKTHGNYRVTIFNLFRGAPGYFEDVIIDAMAPGYSERKQLRDRIAESESVPVVKPRFLDLEQSDAYPTQGPASLHENKPSESTANSQRPLPQTTQSETAFGSGRKKKGPKRRIVDLAGDENISILQSGNNETLQQPTISTVSPDPQVKVIEDISSRARFPIAHIERQQAERMSSSPTVLLREQSSPPALSPPGFSDKGHLLVNEIQNLNLNGEAYRKKVEALKAEVGSNWLSVLSEESWNKHGNGDRRLPQYVQSRPIRPDVSELRVQSQGIVSGSRTLG